MEAEMYAVRIPFRRNKRCAQLIGLLLLAGGGYKIVLLPPAALLLHYALYAAYLLLRIYVAAAQHLLLVRHQLAVAGVVALAYKKAGVLYFHCAARYRVQKISVVRYYYERALISFKKVLKPCYRVHIKMVCGFVQPQ